MTSASLAPALDTLSGAVSEGATPGGALVLVDGRGDTSARIFTFGSTRSPSGLPIGERTRFRLASCSKPVTALVALVAVQENLVDLDTPVHRYLTDFTVGTRFGDDPFDQITLRHLLSHTSGLSRQAPVDNSSHDWSAHVESIRDTWVRFPVGERYAYSDIGIDLVGRIVEVVSGQPFPRFARSRVLGPLGMDDSTFDPKEAGCDPARAIGHIRGQAQDPSGMVPAGSLHASPRDVGRLLQFLLDGGRAGTRRVLAPSLFAEMTTVPFPVAGQVEGYALGVRTRHTPGGWLHGHSGHGFGFQADAWWLPGTGAGAAVMTCSHDFEIRRRIVPRLLGAAGAVGPASRAPASPQQPSPDSLHALAGRYSGSLRGSITFTVDGEGLARVQRDDVEPLVFVGDGDAVSRRGERYRFLTDRDAVRYALRVRDGESWSYNDGPADPPGPDWPEWDPYLGSYEMTSHEGTHGMLDVCKRDGHVYIARERVRSSRGHYLTPRGDRVQLAADGIRVGHRVLLRQSSAGSSR